MSENTQDTFEPVPSMIPDEAVQEELSQADEGERTLPESSQADSTRAVLPGSPTPENTLPPEAQGETNGGPLGCCLGMMVGMLLSLSLAILSRLYIDPLGQLFQSNYALLGLLVRILMGILAFVLAIVFGRIGWRLGKKFYREYEPPVVKTRKKRSRSQK